MKNRIVIIGGGPAGYEAALAGAKYGADVTIIEERGIGGSSVLLDCVPSKSFIAGTGIKTDLRRADDMGLNSLLGRARIHLPALNQRVKNLAEEQSDDIAVQLERAGVKFVNGRGRFAESQIDQVHHEITATLADGSEEVYEADLVLIATGATPRILPNAKPDGERILTWQQVYDLEETPDTLDRACLRRFDLKVEFKYLKASQLWGLFQRECKILGIKVDKSLKERVESLLNISAGDFASIRRQARFFPMQNAQDFYQRLLDESKLKNQNQSKVMGFASNF